MKNWCHQTWHTFFLKIHHCSFGTTTVKPKNHKVSSLTSFNAFCLFLYFFSPLFFWLECKNTTNVSLFWYSLSAVCVKLHISGQRLLFCIERELFSMQESCFHLFEILPMYNLNGLVEVPKVTVIFEVTHSYILLVFVYITWLWVIPFCAPDTAASRTKYKTPQMKV